MKINLNNQVKFEDRHIGPDKSQIAEMLEKIGVKNMETLIKQTIPPNIRQNKFPVLPSATSEFEFLRNIKQIAGKNKVYRSFIGLGYYDTITPGVIQRNILENPGWYTAYTPYQAEIAQGRLEALVNFQTMVMDLTGMALSNASLLDEGTAAAEAMSMLFALRKGPKKEAHTFYVDKSVFPQTIAVLETRAHPMGINLKIQDIENIDLEDPALFGVLLQYPNGDGLVYDPAKMIEEAKNQDVFVAVAADLLSLTLLKPPGEMGADVVVGTTQRFGVPMGYGGPHAGYFATKETFKRQIPGRIIGVSVDRKNNHAYRMALQTREQHIKRERATSNICTAQVLLAVMAGMYAVYHGKNGLKNIALHVHGLTKLLSLGLEEIGFKQINAFYFDTLKIACGPYKEKIISEAITRKFNFRIFDGDFLGISIDETTTLNDIEVILQIFANVGGKDFNKIKSKNHIENLEAQIPPALIRQSDYLTHVVFHENHTEHEMLRYLKRLENKDLSLTHSMIPLGSCTMKLNATTEMIPVTWPEFGKIHPFAPLSQTVGYQQMFEELETWLNEITGFAATCLQPNSGAQGELAGLLTIKAFHDHHGQSHRDVTLIPSSAHGTNPASAVMAGMNVVIVDCDKEGNIDVSDLKSKAAANKDRLSALMVTYPSTHGVFESSIVEICQIIHEMGGLVYMDGANMNAQVGLTSPATIGADVCHLNLHKTFCIPHGGGGPGVGPICVTEALAPFIPGKIFDENGKGQVPAIASAPYGSAGILVISYAYIAMMGFEGLQKSTMVSILNANYIKSRVTGHYKILYTGENGRVAHEMIIDCNEFKSVGIEVEDIAKRLMDYGFHAPTVSFPVAGTMMIEPTESETKEEIDRFCDALISIRAEIQEIEEGTMSKESNVLKNAPHTLETIASDEWPFEYSRQKAAFPLDFVQKNKFWPSVSRIDSAFGDRNLMCSCIPVALYQTSEEVV